MRYLSIILVLACGLTGAQRVVIAELFTATWCGYCPYAARALVRLQNEVGDSLTIIAYHPSGSDPFYNSDAVGRANYYSIPGYPTCWWDGVGSVVGGSSSTYNQYRQWFNGRRNRQPFVEITLIGDYDPSNGQGWATARMKNIVDTTVTGMCHFAIVQSDTPYYWQGEDSLHWIERKMLPNYSGTSVTIAPNETKEVTQNFTVQSSWLRDKCYLTVFVQSTGYPKEILQAAEEDLVNLGVSEGTNGKVRIAQFGPNPLGNYLMVRLNCDHAVMDITDCSGRLTKSINIDQKEMRIPVGDLRPGVYFCLIKTEEGCETKKFVKY